jgi:hypothetical protein
VRIELREQAQTKASNSTEQAALGPYAGTARVMERLPVLDDRGVFIGIVRRKSRI